MSLGSKILISAEIGSLHFFAQTAPADRRQSADCRNRQGGAEEWRSRESLFKELTWNGYRRHLDGNAAVKEIIGLGTGG